MQLHRWQEVAEAISSMAVRGAPAIGIAAAWGVVLAARSGDDLPTAIRGLRASRPTAVNLGWALNRMQAALGSASPVDVDALAGVAAALQQEDRLLTQRLVDVIAAAHARGLLCHAWLDETRPRLQGAALSAWELGCLGVPCTVIVDGASGLLMRRGEVDAVMVGCDRVAANGDVANKIGTYNLALVARAHGIPFYVCAPGSSIDRATVDGDAITIEERDAEEITHAKGVGVAAPGAQAWNPAFDITPAHLVTGFITEFGVLRPPYREVLSALPLPNQL